MEELTIRPRIAQGPVPIVVAELSGKLNAETAPLFEKFAAEVTKRGTTRVVLEATELRYMGSTGFERAVEFATRLKDAGGGVVVAGASPKIRVVLDTLGMQSVFGQAATRDEAIRLLVPQAPAPAGPPGGSFESAERRLRAALAERRIESEPCWVFRDDLASSAAGLRVRLPLPGDNRELARRLYEHRRAQAGATLRILCLLEGRPCACVGPGRDGGSPVEIPAALPTALPASGGVGWFFQRLSSGGDPRLRQAPARAQVPRR